MNAIERLLGMTLVVGLVLLVPAPAHADDVPPAGSVDIDVVTMNGSGCPRGSTPVAMSPDNTYFGITYRGFRAQVSGSSRPTESRKNCQINLRIRSPRGYTQAIRRVEQGGLARVAAGASAFQRSSFYYGGQMPPVWPTLPIRGPYDDVWQRVDDVQSPIYVPCGEYHSVNVNTELRVMKGTSAPHEVSFITQGLDEDWPAADDPPFHGVAMYYLTWRKCP